MTLKLATPLAVLDGEREVLGLVVVLNPDDSVDIVVYPADHLAPTVLLYKSVTPYADKQTAYSAVKDDGVPRVYCYPADAVDSDPAKTTIPPDSGSIVTTPAGA